MSRKTRPGEVVCRCAAYRFPHRFSGGACTGRYLVENHWEESFGGGICRECHSLDEEYGMAQCQVVAGAEKTEACLVWQEFVRLHEIRLGSKYE